MRNKVLLLASAVLFIVICVAGLFAFSRWQLRRSYAMDPSEYRDQVSKIRVGMTRAEVKVRIRGHDDISETSDSLYFQMSPKPRRWFIFSLTNQYLNLTFDDHDRVQRVFGSDG